MRIVQVLLATLAAATAASVSAAPEVPSESLYQLHAELVAQSGTRQPFNVYRGHPTLVSMFYGGCPASCPMLITSLKVYEQQLPAPARARLRVLLISFDPVRDTPQRLAALAREHRADPARWSFSSASEADARRIAALLGVQYRRLPDGGFDHSLLITLLDSDGRPMARTTKLIGDQQFLNQLLTATGSQNLPLRSTPDETDHQ